MKNKIKQFSKGDFTQKQPDICFSETQIFMSVGEGELYEGSFIIEDRKGGTVRGLVYPSSFRVHILEQGFEGNPVKVQFTYDGSGLVPGQMEKGKFTVVCNGGEYALSFTAVVEKPYIMTAYGKVQSVGDFKKLAMEDFGEAKRLFRARQFYEILKYEDSRIRNLYDNMRKWSLDEEALEEFLVSIKQKEKLFLTLSQESVKYEDVLETQKGWLELTKNTWGYTTIRVETIGEFLEVEQTEFTTDDFVGNKKRLEYFVHAKRLHGGNNYGKISIATPYENISVDICVHQSVKRNDMKQLQGMIAGQALKEYLSFIAGKMPMDLWTDKATKRVNQLKEFHPDNEYYTLLQAHIYLRGGRNEEAKWVLENGNFHRFSIGRKPEISAYYQFLTALLKRETIYTNRVLEDLYRVYMKHPYSWQLLCMIIQLDRKYLDYSDRLRVLERQFFNGANQVLLYAEAYLCFQEKVLLLRKLDSFEIQILNFATKYKLLTRELALQMADLACQQKRYDSKLLRLLERAYSVYEEPRILRAICMQLILGNKTEQVYFKWYEQAVCAEMKIAQLYEYYMMSMNPERVTSGFPRIVYLYFLHGISLDYRRTAMLYENILTYEPEGSEIYEQYYEQMKAFATQQLLKRHINPSLRVIYTRLLHPNDVTLDELDAIYDICHAYQVTTKRPGMKYVLVIEKDGSIRQRVSYHPKFGAKVYLYDKEARIVWEADNGVHYADSVPFETKRLFYEMRYLELCEPRRLSEADATKDSRVTLSFENLKLYGLQKFDEQEVFLLCSRRIREQEDVEDDLLLYLCFELLKRGYYDKAVLNYLAHFYCGATCDMKYVWQKAREYGVNTKPLSERIITQMLFSEVIFREEEIFADYLSGRPYFRLKQAYLAYVARMYVVNGRELSERIIQIMQQELAGKEYLADVCKMAIVKFYATRPEEMERTQGLREYFCELCENGLVFPFYLSYPQGWLKEVQLYDKVMVEYHGKPNSKVKILYRLQGEELVGDYHAEVLPAMYENMYVKEFVLYEGELLEYYFEEVEEDERTISEKMVCAKTQIVYEDGKYGRLNLMTRLSKEKRYEAMLHYKKEEQVAKALFPTY